MINQFTTITDVFAGMRSSVVACKTLDEQQQALVDEAFPIIQEVILEPIAKRSWDNILDVPKHRYVPGIGWSLKYHLNSPSWSEGSMVFGSEARAQDGLRSLLVVTGDMLHACRDQDDRPWTPVLRKCPEEVDPDVWSRIPEILEFAAEMRELAVTRTAFTREIYSGREVIRNRTEWKENPALFVGCYVRYSNKRGDKVETGWVVGTKGKKSLLIVPDAYGVSNETLPLDMITIDRYVTLAHHAPGHPPLRFWDPVPCMLTDGSSLDVIFEPKTAEERKKAAEAMMAKINKAKETLDPVWDIYRKWLEDGGSAAVERKERIRRLRENPVDVNVALGNAKQRYDTQPPAVVRVVREMIAEDPTLLETLNRRLNAQLITDAGGDLTEKEQTLIDTTPPDITTSYADRLVEQIKIDDAKTTSK